MSLLPAPGSCNSPASLFFSFPSPLGGYVPEGPCCLPPPFPARPASLPYSNNRPAFLGKVPVRVGVFGWAAIAQALLACVVLCDPYALRDGSGPRFPQYVLSAQTVVGLNLIVSRQDTARSPTADNRSNVRSITPHNTHVKQNNAFVNFITIKAHDMPFPGLSISFKLL